MIYGLLSEAECGQETKIKYKCSMPDSSCGINLELIQCTHAHTDHLDLAKTTVLTLAAGIRTTLAKSRPYVPLMALIFVWAINNDNR